MANRQILPGIFVLTSLVAGFGSVGHADDAESRTIAGRVVDAKTDAPIQYVNLGVPGAAIGTVSGQDGTYRLDGVPPDSRILFSAGAYEPLAVPLKLFPDDGTIRLVPIGLGFRERVSVRAESPGEPRLFGTRYKERGYGMGFASALLGSEIGVRIKIDEPTYIESAHFIVTHTGGEKFLYRINVYDFSGETVGEKLLREDVILEARQERGTLTVDLRELGLVLRDDVLLSLEWIRGDLEMGSGNIMFRAHPRTKSNVFLKLTSQMPFTPIKRHGLGFYFEGHPLD